jgi:hypothetical protein
VCDAFAATVRLSQTGDGFELVRTSFTGTLTVPMVVDAAWRVREAMYLPRAAPALFALNPEFVPCWCPVCDTSYCGAHWRWWHEFDDEDPSWHDCVRGSCPNGHERMLED